jgi:hypothetical protein
VKLDEELRVAFTREAEGRTAPPPDLVGVIIGGRARRRRRTVARLGAVAAASVLVGSAAYGVMQADLSGPGTGIGPASTPRTPLDRTSLPLLDQGRRWLDPGPLRFWAGSDHSGRAIEVEVVVAGRLWESGDYAKLPDRAGSSYVGFGVYRPKALAAGTGCVDDPSTTDPGTTVDELAAKLVALPRSEVLLAPAPTKAFGYDALHLRLRVDSDCPLYYRVAQTHVGDRGITYPGSDGVAADVVIDFWVLDLDGTTIVVDQWRNVDAPAGIVDRATRTRESVTFVGRD